jgi:hypothetical protein
VQGIGNFFVQKVVEDNVLGLSSRELGREFGQSLENTGVDDRLHGLRRKSE